MSGCPPVPRAQELKIFSHSAIKAAPLEAPVIAAVLVLFLHHVAVAGSIFPTTTVFGVYLTSNGNGFTLSEPLIAFVFAVCKAPLPEPCMKAEANPSWIPISH